MVESVLGNLKRIQGILVEKRLARAGCETSWGQRQRLSESHPETIKWTEDDTKHRDQALAGYDRDIRELEGEVKTWEEALGHALDSLEGRV